MDSETALCNCATCEMPMKVKFEGDKIVDVIAVCKCERDWPPSDAAGGGEQRNG